MIEPSIENDQQVIDHLVVKHVDIEEAVFDEGTVAEWRTVRAAVPASIRHVQTTVDHTATPPESTEFYKIILTDPLPLNHRHRLRSVDGSVFRVDRYRSVGLGPQLPEVEVTRIADM